MTRATAATKKAPETQKPLERPVRRLTSGACVLALVLLGGAPVAAATFSVNDTMDRVDTNPGNGVCETTVFTCSLRAAIQEANALAGGHFVTVPAGLFTLTITGPDEDLAESGDLDITSSIDISGAGLGQTIVDGNGADRVFHVHSSTVWIRDMTVRDGRADSAASSFGGGLLVYGGTFDLERVEVTGNVANAAGGMWVGSAAVVDIIDCIFSDNHAAALGFINAFGGAIETRGDTDIVGTTFVGNRADAPPFLAGIYGSGSPALSVRNSTFRDNQGTAIYATNSYVDLRNVTVSRNTGTGLHFGSFNGSHSLSVKNSILADNATDCVLGGVLPTTLDFAGKHNLDSDGTCPLDGGGAGEFDLPSTDPQLGPLLMNGGTSPTLVPLNNSPVIDAGDNGACEANDQRGWARPLDGDGDVAEVCDIGAVEVLPCDAIGDRILQNDTITTSEDLAACFTLTAGPAFTIATPADVTFRARNAIVLANGFSVTGSPTAFRAVLDPAAGWTP